MNLEEEIIKRDLSVVKKQLIQSTIQSIREVTIKSLAQAAKKENEKITVLGDIVINSDIDDTVKRISSYESSRTLDYFTKLSARCITVCSKLCSMEQIKIVSDKMANIINEYVSFLFLYDIYNSDFIKNNNDKSIFANLSTISKNLQKFGISNKTQFLIIMDLIKKNVNADILNYTSSDIKLSFMFVAKKNQLTEDEAVAAYDDVMRNRLYNMDNSKLTKLEKRQKQFLIDLDNIDNGIEEVDLYLDSHKKIKEHYFDKFDENGILRGLSKEDVNIVLSSLEKLNIDEKICSVANNILLKKIDKKEKKEISYKVKKIEKKSSYLDDKEYKAIRKEIGQYFNIHEGIPVKELSEEEVLYCASLMLKIQIDDKSIITLFDRGLLNIKNPIEKYKKDRDKYLYYSSRMGLQQDIEQLDEIFNEAISAKEEDKIIWSNMLGEQLQNIDYKIPHKYEYEKIKSKEFVKKK